MFLVTVARVNRDQVVANRRPWIMYYYSSPVESDARAHHLVASLSGRHYPMWPGLNRLLFNTTTLSSNNWTATHLIVGRTTFLAFNNSHDRRFARSASIYIVRLQEYNTHYRTPCLCSHILSDHSGVLRSGLLRSSSSPRRRTCLLRNNNNQPPYTQICWQCTHVWLLIRPREHFPPTAPICCGSHPQRI